MSVSKVVRIGSDKTIKLQSNRTAKGLNYPADSYIREGKPEIVVKTTTVSQDDLKGMLVYGLGQGSVSLDVFLTWFTKTSLMGGETCPEDWKSFNNVICKKGEKVSIGNILVIKQEGTLDTAGLQTNMTSLEEIPDLAVAMACLSVYRLNTRNSAYSEALLSKLKEHILSLSNGKLEIIGGTAGQKDWLCNANFLRLVGAIDMYYYRFDQVDSALIRFCTLTSRYRDCSALLSIGYFCRITGITEVDFAAWVWADKVADQVVQVLKDGQETEYEYSYFCYFSCMGMGKNSPYSASNNAELHAWVHAVGALLHQGRSVNAVKVGEFSISDIIQHATLAAYGLGRGYTLKKTFKRVNEADEEAPMTVSDEPVGKNGDTWRLYFTNIGFNDDMKEWFRETAEKISSPREGTIGEMVKSYVMPQ
ncbi:nucleoprotein [Hainan black-spectacled toad rhabdovirus]|uniref:Nucleoprotein n=1 Tax=Hainan black-spectacled toad rhabdovirus TaxID=2847103 RepID=A0A2P1GNA1_9RHAB|nr:nucleoprotein [Hainan black-spectacled toad rhabdovirus]AVM87299.1 nucleoprotein [Hainan black-spectacled toad rhabdovirus]